jgi:hypothetical protein
MRSGPGAVETIKRRPSMAIALRPLSLLLCLALLTASLWPRPAVAGWVSPGPLARAHEDLDGPDQCEKCHDAGAGVRNERCVACHGEVAGPPGGRDTWHFREQVQGSGKACAGCHSDHKGRSYPLIRWTPPQGFDHAPTGFVLDGAHGALGCGECHTRQPRYLMKRADCAGCHDDPHGGQLGARCERCHTTSAFVPPARFDHGRAKFPLDGRHASVACASCHLPGADGVPKYSGIEHGRCASCHADPHGGRTFLSDCSSCHEVGGWEKTRGLPPAHGPSGWPLVGSHAKVDCADCHGLDLQRSVDAACASCHSDPHGGRFGLDCAKCHDERSWKQQKAGSFDHSMTRFPLRQKHAQVSCKACHGPSKGRAAVYKGLPFGRCEDCHADPHHMDFVSVEDTCSACHDESGFSPAAYGVVAHERARWPLEGSHRAVRCEGCHKPTERGVPDLAVADHRCASCHPSPHGEQFADVIAARDCAACHTVRGFRSSAFDHDQTRFPLRGAHVGSACASCHRGDPVQYQGLPVACEGCHADPHMAQFTTEPSPLGCADCHAVESFQIDQFDHLGRAGWALDGGHATVACAGCHPAVPLPTEQGISEVVHWRLGSMACADCHANPHASTGGRP